LAASVVVVTTNVDDGSAVGVEVAVAGGVAVTVGVSVTVAPASYAPVSQCAPDGRKNPR
jgi:hypothetical protein